MQSIEARNLSAARAYALLVGIVVPRPIAWITSTDCHGRVNAAPFSCYTFVCNKPPMIAVNIGRRGGEKKDTERNLRATGGFVVIAAYGTKGLDPVHPGYIPFGVTNPIFVNP